MSRLPSEPSPVLEAGGWLIMDEWPKESEEYRVGAALVLLSRGERIDESIEESAESMNEYLPKGSSDSDLAVARP